MNFFSCCVCQVDCAVLVYSVGAYYCYIAVDGYKEVVEVLASHLQMVRRFISYVIYLRQTKC
jgi:hypothetical protein